MRTQNTPLPCTGVCIIVHRCIFLGTTIYNNHVFTSKCYQLERQLSIKDPFLGDFFANFSFLMRGTISAEMPQTWDTTTLDGPGPGRISGGCFRLCSYMSAWSLCSRYSYMLDWAHMTTRKTGLYLCTLRTACLIP